MLRTMGEGEGSKKQREQTGIMELFSRAPNHWLINRDPEGHITLVYFPTTDQASGPGPDQSFMGPQPHSTVHDQPLGVPDLQVFLGK